MGYEKEAAEIQDKYLAGDKDGRGRRRPARADRLRPRCSAPSSASPSGCRPTRTAGVTTLSLAPAGFTLDERLSGAAGRGRGPGAGRAGVVGRRALVARRASGDACGRGGGSGVFPATAVTQHNAPRAEGYATGLRDRGYGAGLRTGRRALARHSQPRRLNTPEQAEAPRSPSAPAPPDTPTPSAAPACGRSSCRRSRRSAVGTANIAAQAEILRMSSFWRTPICARCAERMSDSSRSRPSTCSLTRVRWSLTSRKNGRDVLVHERHPGARQPRPAARPAGRWPGGTPAPAA